MLHDEGPAPSTPNPVSQPLAPFTSEFVGSSAGSAPARVGPPARTVAFLEVLFCSDIPTQLLVMQVLSGAGVEPTTADGRLSILYVASLSLIDATLLIALMGLFLAVHGERARDVFLGPRRWGRELGLGLLLTPAAFFIAVLLLGVVLKFAPWLHNVPENPLADLIARPRDAMIFVVVAIVAGGVREEMQRAFVLHRFERYLGGPVVGLVVFSVAFGAGHLLQGRDVALITATLGAFWGVVYLRRRSIVAPAVSHSLFNVSQIAQHSFFP
jgi:membrane protease YdiL (CAAX protease family)